jgi:hypothetical protein
VNLIKMFCWFPKILQVIGASGSVVTPVSSVVWAECWFQAQFCKVI